MLTTIKEKATGWVAWAIVILITIPFALWGIQSYFEGGTNVVVAEVDGDEITLGIYQSALADKRRAVLEAYGSRIDPALLSSEQFRRAVLDELIDDRLITQAVRSSGYRVGDKLLGAIIRSDPEFIENGLFDQERYANYLYRVGTSESQFEELSRSRVALDQLMSGYRLSSITTGSAVDHLLALLMQERDADYALLPRAKFIDTGNISDQVVDQYYQSNKERFRSTERMKVSYLELSVEALAAKESPSEDEIKSAYKENKARYRAPEQRRASHVLIQVGSEAAEDEVAAARKRADEIAQKAREGGDFSALAKQYSEDAGSAVNGGDLGVIVEGSMEKPFEEAVISLQKEGIADPVRTQFGFHVIKLTDLIPERIKPYEQVRKKVAEEVKRSRAENRFVELAEAFRNLTYEFPDNLDTTAEAIELEIKQSDWFTREQGSGVTESEAVRNAAFSQEVLNEELNSEAIEKDMDTLIALRRHSFDPSRQLSFDEVSSDIRQQLALEQSGEQVIDYGKQLVDLLNKGESWESLLERDELKSLPAPARRGDAKDALSNEVLQTLFAAPRPERSTPVFGGKALINGDYLLFQLKGVRKGDVSKATAEERQGVVQLLEGRFGSELFDAYQRDLRSRAEIKIDDSAVVGETDEGL